MNQAYKFAQSKLGLKEIKGEQHNPEIVEMFAAVGYGRIKNDETLWDGAFVGWCLKSAGMPYLNEVAARKYEKYGTETKTPKVGDIVVIWRESKDSWKGHVGFLHSMDEKDIYILGGNQNNEVCVRRFERKRLLSFRSVTGESLRIKEEEEVFMTDEMYLPIHYKGIIVEEPYYKGDGNHSVAELEELCRRYKERTHQQAVIKQNCMKAIVKLRSKA